MIIIAACTYKRPDFLSRMLDHIAALDLPTEAGVVIVDNDGANPEVEALVSAFRANTNLPTSYIVETTPGISAARNAAFKGARAMGGKTLAMLDDDEWPPANWVAALLAERDRTGAQVVGGPVRPVFSEAQSHLRKHARFWSVEKEMLDGKPFVFCTCNFLLELAATDFLGNQPFDEEFGITGGGDTVFFRKLFDKGVPMAWSEDAFLYEEIPDSRANVKWLRQRRYRQGNAAVRWERATPTDRDINPLVKTAMLFGRFAIYPLMSREKTDRKLAWLLEFEKLRGRVAAHRSVYYEEYKRPGEGAGKACR